MKILGRLSLTLVLLFFMLTAAGCFEIEEKTYINEGGGCDMSFVMRFTSPSEKKGKELQKELKSDELQKTMKDLNGVSMTGFEVKNSFGQIVLSMKFHTDECSKLAKVHANIPDEMDKEGGSGMKTAFSEDNYYKFKKKGSKIEITRTIGPIDTGKTEKKDQLGNELASMMLGGMKLRFELDVPSKVISSNAEDSSNNTLSWVLPLSYLQKNKAVLRATIESTPELEKAFK